MLMLQKVIAPGLIHNEGDLVLLAGCRDGLVEAPGPRPLTPILGPGPAKGCGLRLRSAGHGLGGAGVVSLPPVGPGPPHVRPQVVVVLGVAARSHVENPVLPSHPIIVRNRGEIRYRKCDGTISEFPIRSCTVHYAELDLRDRAAITEMK